MKKWATNLLSRPGMACRTDLRAAIACAALYADASGQALAAGVAQGRNQSQPRNPEAAQWHWTPLQLAIGPGRAAAIPPAGTVTGLRLCLPWGECKGVYGVDAGLICDAADMYGIQASVVNGMSLRGGAGGNAEGMIVGLQVGVANANCRRASVVGLQAAGIFTHQFGKYMAFTLATESQSSGAWAKAKAAFG